MNRLLLLILVVFGIHKMGVSQLDSTYQDIEEVIISADKEKTIAFEDPKYYIVDFTVFEDQTLLLMKNFGTYYLYSLDENMDFRHKLKLKTRANYLFEDCFGNTHVVTDDSVYFVLNDPHGIFLTETRSTRSRYYNVLTKCVGTTTDKFILEKRSKDKRDQTFYTIDLDSSYREVIYEISDSTIALSRRADRRMKREERHFADNGQPVELNENRYLPGFFYRDYSPPKYNPLFVVNDTIYIFNHAEGRIDELDDSGNVISSKRINYQFRKGWEAMIHSDKTSKKFYAVWMKNGVKHLTGLGLNEDEQDFSSQITEHAYPEKVIVRNGYVYYAYKPSHDANLNKFYRQKL